MGPARFHCATLLSSLFLSSIYFKNVVQLENSHVISDTSSPVIQVNASSLDKRFQIQQDPLRDWNIENTQKQISYIIDSVTVIMTL